MCVCVCLYNISKCIFFSLYSPSPADRSAGGRFQIEFDETSRKLQDFVECLGIEVTERKNVTDMLNDGKSYFSEKLIELQSLYNVSVINLGRCGMHYNGGVVAIYGFLILI